jgi:hypothetical protein
LNLRILTNLTPVCERCVFTYSSFFVWSGNHTFFIQFLRLLGLQSFIIKNKPVHIHFLLWLANHQDPTIFFFLWYSIGWFKMIVDKYGNYAQKFMCQLCRWGRVGICMTSSRVTAIIIRSLNNILFFTIIEKVIVF